MEIIAVSGKGGVGKSTVAAAMALNYATQGARTLLVDGDKGGRAITRTISPQGRLTIARPYFQVADNLYGASTSGFSFDPLPLGDSEEAARLRRQGVNRNEQFRRYIEQFPRDYGLVALNDMMSMFFGVNTAVEQTASLISLTQLVFPEKGEGFEKIVLDLEPTQGFSRMLGNADKTVNTVRAMHEYGIGKMFMVSVAWPDVNRFLKGEYIANIDHHSKRLLMIAEALRSANYVLVTGPGIAMVDEMFEDTQPVVDSFGGRTAGYVINDLREYTGEEAVSQQRQVARVRAAAAEREIPSMGIWHDAELGLDQVSDAVRQGALRAAGRDLVQRICVEGYDPRAAVDTSFFAGESLSRRVRGMGGEDEDGALDFSNVGRDFFDEFGLMSLESLGIMP